MTRQQKEEELRVRLKEMILNKVSQASQSGEELQTIVEEHMKLSQALGFAVGIHTNTEKIERKVSLFD